MCRQLYLKNTTRGTRDGLKVPQPMSKDEYSKAQALRLVTYSVTLTNLFDIGTLSYRSVIVEIMYDGVLESLNSRRQGGEC